MNRSSSQVFRWTTAALIGLTLPAVGFGQTKRHEANPPSAEAVALLQAFEQKVRAVQTLADSIKRRAQWVKSEGDRLDSQADAIGRSKAQLSRLAQTATTATDPRQREAARLRHNDLVNPLKQSIAQHNREVERFNLVRENVKRDFQEIERLRNSAEATGRRLQSVLAAPKPSRSPDSFGEIEQRAKGTPSRRSPDSMAEIEQRSRQSNGGLVVDDNAKRAPLPGGKR